MSDLVSRLRSLNLWAQDDWMHTVSEAAAEITRLQKALETAREEALEQAARLVEEDVIGSILDTFVVNGATLTNTKGHDTFMSTFRVTELLRKRASAIRSLKDKEVADVR